MLDKKLEQLKIIATKLNAESDKITRTIGMVENFLQDIDIGLQARLKFSFDDKDYYFIYGKAKDGYRFYICIDTKITYWQSCSRQLKLQIFKLLPLMLDQLIDKSNALGTDQTDTIDAILEKLGKL